MGLELGCCTTRDKTVFAARGECRSAEVLSRSKHLEGTAGLQSSYATRPITTKKMTFQQQDQK